MSSEENRREPEAREEPEAPEGIDEAQESPGEPVEEDPGTPEEPEGLPVEEATEEELAALSAELEVTRRERVEYLEALRRLKAEFENSR
ncbi:MAG: hypothetical protein ACJ732_07825 [Rubrobacteraceae bacterium]